MSTTVRADAPARPLAPIGKVFAAVAIVEAFTWVGLLVGMYFKWIAQTSEMGVKIFGPIHGTVVLIYVALALLTAWKLKWRFGTLVWALVAAVPPLATVPLEIWMRRTGRLSAPVTTPAAPE